MKIDIFGDNGMLRMSVTDTEIEAEQIRWEAVELPKENNSPLYEEQLKAAQVVISDQESRIREVEEALIRMQEKAEVDEASWKKDIEGADRQQAVAEHEADKWKARAIASHTVAMHYGINLPIFFFDVLGGLPTYFDSRGRVIAFQDRKKVVEVVKLVGMNTEDLMEKFTDHAHELSGEDAGFGSSWWVCGHCQLRYHREENAK